MPSATRLFLALLLTALVLPACDSGGPDTSEPEPEPEPTPSAAFSASATTVAVGEEITFTNESENADTWSWSFGDEETSTSESPSHAYAEPGTYTVTLEASNDEGSDTEEKADYITVEAEPVPEAAFSAEPTTITAGEEVTFTNESENADSYSWDFGDGETSEDESPAHTYAEAGTYTVSLTASSETGEDTEEKENYITVEELPMPEAAFSAEPTTITAGEEVTFTNESENADSYEWDFGDGNDSADASPTHTYEEAGTYTVSLTASGETGEDTEEKADLITVEAPPMLPEAAFSVSETTVGIADTLSFTDESQNAESWLWDFDDGTTSDEQNPTHAFEEEGTYFIDLTVTNEDGSDTAFETVVVEPRRTFRVEYRADATFEECTVRYDNEDGGRTQRDLTFEDGPWTLALNITAREFNSAFAGFSLSCSDFETDGTVSGELIIDGEVFDSGEQSGSSVSLRFDALLTLDGAEEF